MISKAVLKPREEGKEEEEEAGRDGTAFGPGVRVTITTVKNRLKTETGRER